MSQEKMQPRTVVRNGITYHSVAECCRAIGVSESAVRSAARCRNTTPVKLLENGWLPHHNNKNCIPITRDGITYRSIKECCQSIGISQKSLKSAAQYLGTTSAILLENGWPSHFPQSTSYKHPAIIRDGVAYKSINACCAAVGISVNTLKAAAKYQNTTAKALLESGWEPHFKEQGAVTRDGVKYRNILECCQSIGLSINTLKAAAKQQNTTAKALLKSGWGPRSKRTQLQYVGRTGLPYFKKTCPICKRHLILSETEMSEFYHENSFCISHSPPTKGKSK